jgi:iron complex outermembrane recepter protein
MSRTHFIHHIAVTLLCAASLAGIAHAEEFNIPSGDLKSALAVYARQSGIAVLFSSETIKGVQTKGVKGDLPALDALTRILAGTGLATYRDPDGSVGISKRTSFNEPTGFEPRLAAAMAPTVSGAALETVTVTSSKIGGDVQNIPIAITALSQEQLTSRQIAGGPDLVKEVPNLTFSKTNFTGYNIQIRGIGTQAISVTTDPAVAVALNDIPFIRNHFFEQEFYDVNQVEVLRGPQGTLYGRNATAGVVNVISAKPTDQFEAMSSADIGNYHNRRFEGMVNVPIVDDRLDIRVAGEWTKRDGYSFNTITNAPIDGRDLWSSRVTIGWKPSENLHTTLVWEHFGENDDRMRTAKQLCKTDTPPTSVNGAPVQPGSLSIGGAVSLGADYLSQGCESTSLYSPDAFEVPYGFSLPYAVALGTIGVANQAVDPYASTTQSQNLRVIEATINPHYQAKNDVVELNADYAVTPSLTFTSQSGYNQDFLSSTEDYNRFNTSPGIFCADCVSGGFVEGQESSRHAVSSDGTFCDPQLGCSSRIVAEDLSDEHAWQLSQEFRLTSNFNGPLNFSVGGNYLHYETEENYYVFINSLSLFSVDGGDQNAATDGSSPYIPGVTDNHQCLQSSSGAHGYQAPNPILSGGQPTGTCIYIDPNTIGNLNNKGHNYFLSQNPYVLNSYAGFGEVYYNIASDLKLTGGLRWTEDRKRFIDIPSEVITRGYGYYVTQVVNQQWDQLTGRAAMNWMPKLDFTDQTLVYGSYSRGYKAGGANPPGAVLNGIGAGAPTIAEPVHPLIFRPVFVVKTFGTDVGVI